MINIRNRDFDIAPLSLSWELGTPDAEGWRTYRMGLQRNERDALVGFSGALSTACTSRLAQGLDALLSGATQTFEYEPMEPAFRLTLTRAGSDVFRLLCLVDEPFAAGGPATETGIGLALFASQADVQRLRGLLG